MPQVQCQFYLLFPELNAGFGNLCKKKMLQELYPDFTD